MDAENLSQSDVTKSSSPIECASSGLETARAMYAALVEAVDHLDGYYGSTSPVTTKALAKAGAGQDALLLASEPEMYEALLDVAAFLFEIGAAPELPAVHAAIAKAQSQHGRAPVTFSTTSVFGIADEVSP